MVSDTSLPLALSLESAFAAADLAAMFPLASPVLAGLPSGSSHGRNIQLVGSSSVQKPVLELINIYYIAS